MQPGVCRIKPSGPLPSNHLLFCAFLRLFVAVLHTVHLQRTFRFLQYLNRARSAQPQMTATAKNSRLARALAVPSSQPRCTSRNSSSGLSPSPRLRRTGRPPSPPRRGRGMGWGWGEGAARRLRCARRASPPPHNHHRLRRKSLLHLGERGFGVGGDLLFAEVLFVRGNRPLMAEGIFRHAIAIAPELVG